MDGDEKAFPYKIRLSAVQQRCGVYDDCARTRGEIKRWAVSRLFRNPSRFLRSKHRVRGKDRYLICLRATRYMEGGREGVVVDGVIPDAHCLTLAHNNIELQRALAHLQWQF